MTQREILFASLRGEKLDIIPVWLLFPYHPTSYYVDVRNHAKYLKIHQASLNRAIILNRRNLSVPIFSDNSYLPGKLQNENDLKNLASMQILTDKRIIHKVLESQMEKYLREKAEFPEEYGAMMLDLSEPVNFIYGNSNLEEFAIWSLTAPDIVKVILDKLMERLRIIYEYCLERNLADIYFFVGSELASPPMVNVETFKEWIVPYAKELIKMVHSAGKFAIQHFHGQIKDILPCFLDMDPDALHTIEAPPVGNCTFTEAFDTIGDKITLIGNVQYDAFRSMTPDEMKQEVRRIKAECYGRRLILSPTAGPFDLNPSDSLIANYMAFLDAAEE